MTLNTPQNYEWPNAVAPQGDILEVLWRDIVLPAAWEAIDIADLAPRVWVDAQAAINATRLMRSLVTA